MDITSGIVGIMHAMKGWQIAMRAHRSMTTLVLSLAMDMKKYNDDVPVYVSQEDGYFRQSNVNVVKEASPDSMDDGSWMDGYPLKGAFFLGGKGRVMKDFDYFTSHFPSRPVFAFGGTGGDASAISMKISIDPAVDWEFRNSRFYNMLAIRASKLISPYFREENTSFRRW